MDGGKIRGRSRRAVWGRVAAIALGLWAVTTTTILITERSDDPALVVAGPDLSRLSPVPPAAAAEAACCPDVPRGALRLRPDADGSSQHDLIARMVVLAASSIGEMESTLRIAGLDPSEVAPRSGDIGGPLVRRGDGHGEGGGLAASLAALNVHLARWDELNRVIHSLPLAEPLVDYAVSSPFGTRIDPMTHHQAVHEGIDLVAKRGTPVEATAGGLVIFAGVKPGYGRVVEVDHGHDVTTVYAHLRTILVRQGQRLATGARIGRVGSTGPHLHYEVRVKGVPRDPAQFLYAGRIILANGG